MMAWRMCTYLCIYYLFIIRFVLCLSPWKVRMTYQSSMLKTCKRSNRASEKGACVEGGLEYSWVPSLDLCSKAPCFIFLRNRRVWEKIREWTKKLSLEWDMVSSRFQGPLANCPPRGPGTPQSSWWSWVLVDEIGESEQLSWSIHFNPTTAHGVWTYLFI